MAFRPVARLTTVAFNNPEPKVDKSILACPCLNISLYLANEVTDPSTVENQVQQLGLAGVVVKQKILCDISIHQGTATVSCTNCLQEIYTFVPSLTAVNLDSTPLAFLGTNIQYSPGDGKVRPKPNLLSATQVVKVHQDPEYSAAFQLLIKSVGSAASSESTPGNGSDNQLANQQQKQPQARPDLDPVRILLEAEVESNLIAQEQRTLARIEAYKSQQLAALDQARENTKAEKARLWEKIQSCISTSAAHAAAARVRAATDIGSPGSDQDPLAEIGPQGMAGVYGTMPVRMYTSTMMARPTLGSSLYQQQSSLSISGQNRRMSTLANTSSNEIAMSLQFQEFDQLMYNNSFKRQSKVPVNSYVPQQEEISDDCKTGATTPAASTGTPIASALKASGTSSPANPGSPSAKPKKHVSIVEGVSDINIARSTVNSDTDDDELLVMNDDDDDDVFVLDEELGHEVESTKGPSANKGKAKTENDHNAAEDEDPDNNTASRAGNPLQMSGSMAGSLRASYLRRQDFLDARFRSKVGTTTEVEISDLVKETAPSNSDESELTASMFGTSLPITIRGPSTVRKKAANGSGAQLPPGSSPAGAMLQRRLSRTYGITEENGSLLKVARLGTASNNSVNNSAITGRSVTAATGNLALNPALLVADDFDRVEEEDDDDDENQGGNGARRGFEPPHVFSARTYQPDGIWEKPTRVTVRSGGMEREGSDLDKAIEQARVKLEEEERHNSIATTGAVVPSSAPPGLRTGLNASQNSIKATTATIQEEGEEDA